MTETSTTNKIDPQSFFTGENDGTPCWTEPTANVLPVRRQASEKRQPNGNQIGFCDPKRQKC
jgi:hypothetical protein